MKTKLFSTILLNLFLSGCFLANADSISETITSAKLNEFSGIIVNSASNVIISQGETNSITVEGDKCELRNFSTEINNGLLILKGSNENAVTVYITVHNLRMVEVNGNSKVYAKNVINSDILFLSVNGAGSIKMDSRTTSIGMIVKGSGKIIASGRTEESFSKVIGTGSIFKAKLAIFHPISKRNSNGSIS